MKNQNFEKLENISNLIIVWKTSQKSLEAEREAAIQNFCLTLQKSCHKNDEPPKEKHIRATIVQTHEGKRSFS